VKRKSGLGGSIVLVVVVMGVPIKLLLSMGRGTRLYLTE
jgi:hypothetical protein